MALSNVGNGPASEPEKQQVAMKTKLNKKQLEMAYFAPGTTAC